MQAFDTQDPAVRAAADRFRDVLIARMASNLAKESMRRTAGQAMILDQAVPPSWLKSFHEADLRHFDRTDTHFNTQQAQAWLAAQVADEGTVDVTKEAVDAALLAGTAGAIGWQVGRAVAPAAIRAGRSAAGALLRRSIKAPAVRTVHPEVLTAKLEATHFVPQTLEQVAQREIAFPARQLQSKFDKHSADFLGEQVNYNTGNALRFQQAMLQHIRNPRTMLIEGTYRGTEPVNHYFDPLTRRWVMTHRVGSKAGEFYSGWELDSRQIKYLFMKGNVQ